MKYLKLTGNKNLDTMRMVLLTLFVVFATAYFVGYVVGTVEKLFF